MFIASLRVEPVAAAIRGGGQLGGAADELLCVALCSMQRDAHVDIDSKWQHVLL